ncbi:hypothetical protein KC356_g4722 [Hortaea werneckii]|nr:hypothetical protein KC356_g4722 [Hortaea werneckii]
MAKKRHRHSQGNSANQTSAPPPPKKQKVVDGHARQSTTATTKDDTNGEGQDPIEPSDDRKDQIQKPVVKTPSAEAPSHLSRKQRKRWRKRLEEAGEAAAAQYAAQAFAEGNSEQALSPSIQPSEAKTVRGHSTRKPVSKDLMRKLTATTLATPPRKRWVEMDAQLLRESKQGERKGVVETGNSPGARKGKSDQVESADRDAPLKNDVSKASEVTSTSQPLAKSVPKNQGQPSIATIGKLSESIADSHDRPSLSRNLTEEDASEDPDHETDDASDESSNNEGKGTLPGLARLSTVPPRDDSGSTNSDLAASSEVKATLPSTATPEKSTLDILRATSEKSNLSSMRTSPVAPSLSSFGASLRNSYGGPGGSLAFTAPVATKPTSVPMTNVREDVRTVFDRFSAFVGGHDGDDSDDEDDDDDDDESSGDESDVVKDARPVSGQQTGGQLAEKSLTSFAEDTKSISPSEVSETIQSSVKHEVDVGQSMAATELPKSATAEKQQPNHEQNAAAREGNDDKSDVESESADSDSSVSTAAGMKPMPQLGGAGSGSSNTHQRNVADIPEQSSVETESEIGETNNAAAASSSSPEQGKSNTQREEDQVPVESAVEGDGASVESANEDTSEVVEVQDHLSTSVTSASEAGKNNDIVPNTRTENEDQSLLQNDAASEAESEAEEEVPSLDVKPCSSSVEKNIHASVEPDGHLHTRTRSQSLQQSEEARTTSSLQKVEPSRQTSDEPTKGMSHNSTEPHDDGTTNASAGRGQSAKLKGANQTMASDDSSESDSGNDETWPSLLLHRSSVSHSSPRLSHSRHSRDHEPDSEEDSGHEDDTPASQIQRDLGQEQTDPTSSGTVLVPDSANTSQQTKGAKNDVVENHSDGDDDETDDADAKVQSSQANEGRAEAAHPPTAFTPINAAAEAHSQANIGSRSTGARPKAKKQISFLDQRPGSADSAPAQAAPFPDRMEDDDINQTIDEISRDVLKNSTRPLPPSKSLNLSARTNADDPDSGDLTMNPSLHELECQLAAHHRVAKEVSIPMPDPALFKNVIVYCSREVPVFQPQLEVDSSSLDKGGRGVEGDGAASDAEATQKSVGKTDDPHQNTNILGVELPLLQRQNSSSSLSELGPSPSPPATQSKEPLSKRNQSQVAADELPKPQEEQVRPAGNESEDAVTAEEDTKRDKVSPTELRRKRKMTGMTSKHFSPPKRTTRARAKAGSPTQTPLEDTGQAVVADDRLESAAEPTSDAAEPPTPVTKKTRPKRKTTGKKSNHFLPFDLLDRVDLPLPPPPPSSSITSPSRPRLTPGVSRAPIPPISSPTFGIIQEKLHKEPFWLLIATTFLNQTSGRAAVPVFWALKNRFPTPAALAEAEYEVVLEMIRHLGLQRQRAKRVILMAQVWRDDPPRVGRRFRTKDYPDKGDHVGFNVRGRGGKGKGKGKKGKKGKQEEEEEEEKKKIVEGEEETKSGDEQGKKGSAGGGDGNNEAVSGSEGDTTECKGSLEIGHIPGCGRYAYDSWRIFCRDVLRGVAEDYNGKRAIPPPPPPHGTPPPADLSTKISAPKASKEEGKEGEEEEATLPFEPEWKRVLPQDKELIATLRWMWLREGWIWDPFDGGARRLATPEEMERARRGEMEVQDARERTFAVRALGGGGGAEDG